MTAIKGAGMKKNHVLQAFDALKSAAVCIIIEKSNEVVYENKYFQGLTGKKTGDVCNPDEIEDIFGQYMDIVVSQAEWDEKEQAKLYIVTPKAMQEQEIIIRSISNTYFAIYLIDIESGKTDVIKETRKLTRYEEYFEAGELQALFTGERERVEHEYYEHSSQRDEWIAVTAYKAPNLKEFEKKVVVTFQNIDEIKRAEIEQMKQEVIISMLSDKYYAVFLANLKTQEFKTVRGYKKLDFNFKFKFDEDMEAYTGRRVLEEDQEECYRQCRSQRVLNELLEGNDSWEHMYRTKKGEWIRMSIVTTPYFSRNMPEVIVAFENYDRVMRRREKEIEERLREKQMLQILKRFYAAMLLIDLENGSYKKIDFSGESTINVAEEGDYETVYRKRFGELQDGYGETMQVHFGLGMLRKLSEIPDAVRPKVYIPVSEPRSAKQAWYEITAFFISEGKKSLACITRRDVTDEKRAQEFVREQNIALKKALGDAEEAGKAKGMFLSNMSHDIRTPMNAIMGMTAVAKKNISNREKLGECLDTIEVSSRHLLSLINNVLDMSKIESGKFDLKLSENNLTDFIQEVSNIVKVKCEDKKQSFWIDTSEIRHNEVLMDVVRMRQVLMNICSNAVKFTPEYGEVFITVQEQEICEKDRNRYIFRVADTGIGMSEEFISRIFQPFEQEDNKYSSENEGAGLGMAIVHYIVDMMKGKIWIDSAVEKGTTITVELDLLKTQTTIPRNEREPLQFTFPGKRILLVEDKHINMEIVKELLQDTQIEIEEAVNGRQAVEMVKDLPAGYYDLIFMDIRMPVLKGDEATMQIRGLGRPDTAELPIIAMTANAFEEDIRHSQEIGMNDHIAKPVETDEILRVLNKWLT